MKYIYVSFVSLMLTLLVSCDEKYNLSTAFSVPTELSSPASVVLDVTSSDHVLLSWSGGGAEDGSLVIYEVLFDKPGGDFSHPLFRAFSDMGVDSRLTINHANLNTIARKAGIKPDESGNIIWTVYASKSGEVRSSGIVKTIDVTRGEGIDNMPTQLYLYGSATENGGTGALPFREASDGVFVIYSKVANTGSLFLRGGTDADADQYYLDGEKLKEGDRTFQFTPNANPYRITVDFNTLSIRKEVISDVRAIWGATFGTIGNLSYAGNGKFKGDGCKVIFVDPSRPETNPPGWLGWTEERYYFIANVDGSDKCWGRNDNISGERPGANEPLKFYELIEFPWSQWEHLWKMSGSLDMKKCTITIDTNLDGLMVHQFTNVAPL